MASPQVYLNRIEQSDVPLKIEEIADDKRLKEISAPWQRLCEKCYYSTPFQSPAWIVPWWERFASGKLRTLALWSGDDLAGLAPLYSHPGLDGVTRQITFLGTGNTDYLDILVDPGVIPQGVETILNALGQRRSEWDECDFLDLKGDSPLLSATVPVGFRAKVGPLAVCPVALLPGTMEAYLQTLSPVHRRKARKERRTLEEMGTLLLETAGARMLQEYLTDFFRLHCAWWKERGEQGVLSGEGIQTFHREAATRFLEIGWLRFFRLSLDGKPVAYVYGLKKGNRFYSYLGALDPAMEQYSPGVVILLMIIEKCIQEGLREFDFLRGEERYKYLWGAKKTQTYRYTLKKA
jgi:CelD/BcsL family acetyltransferase involved in cellulose biosynthesis